MLSIVIIEDNLHFSKALEQIIAQLPNAELMKSYADAETAIKELPAFSPDIVIVDVQLKGTLNGIDIIKQTRSVLKTTEFLVCTVHDDSEFVFDALRSGAGGYVLKDASSDEILNAITELANGGAPMSPYIARKVIASFREQGIPVGEEAELTQREKEVLRQLALGMLYKEIADNLSISRNTVKKHIRNIYDKLQVQNKIEALNKLRLL